MTASICSKCGRELVDVCPECHQPVEVYSRVVGYLRPVATWNDGKRQEFADRQEYAIDRKAEHLRGDHAEER